MATVVSLDGQGLKRLTRSFKLLDQESEQGGATEVRC